jgi:hypothetical protein
MAIKDKNGKVFILRGPNPLMKSQQEWDRSRIQLFNMKGWKNEVVHDSHNPVEAFAANVIDIGEDLKLTPKRAKIIEPRKFIEEIREAPKEKPNVFKIPEIVQPTLNVDPKMARILKERGAEYYCAPAIGRKDHTDDLYGSSYSTIEYGEKFIFDAVVIDQSDLELQIWCIRPVTSHSVIYKKIRQGGERWWRIVNVESKTGGWLAKAVTSDSNPDFS